MKKLMFLAVVIFVLAILILPNLVAQAHNAGHVILPSGECINVGSGKSGPELFEGHPHVVMELDDEGNVVWRLDLIEGRGDQYGARFAVERGKTPILLGACP